MGETTEIAWCDSTFNPWSGCTKVSPGCANCYAEKMCNRFGHLGGWGPGAERKRTGNANWRKPLGWERAGATGADLWDGGTGEETPHRRKVFCGSLCDWLDPEVPAEWLADLLALIAETPHIDWLLLTKRPELWRERMRAIGSIDHMAAYDAGHWLDGNAPDNVWLGTTVEDADRRYRIDRLIEIPARVRFLSVEPMLSRVDLLPPWIPHIDWVICGGESGPNARPMNPDWARSLRDQCESAGVPFLFKQWGEFAPAAMHSLLGPDDMQRVGKKAAGRLLDGKTHDEFPQ